MTFPGSGSKSTVGFPKAGTIGWLGFCERVIPTRSLLRTSKIGCLLGCWVVGSLGHIPRGGTGLDPTGWG